MSGEPYLDPLTAADALLDYIAGGDESVAKLPELAARLDAFMYSLRFLRTDSVLTIQETDAEPPTTPYEKWRGIICPRFPTLGLYWSVLSMRMIPGEDAKSAVSDAIDDLADIANELSEVRWYASIHGRDEGLAALRWRYEHHLNMHLMPFRNHLEEEIFELY